MDIKQYMQQLGQQARAAARVLAAADSGAKNRALAAIAEAVDASRQAIAEANQKDLQAGEAAGLDAAMLDRLALTPARIDGIIEGLKQVAALPDPVGEISNMSYRPSGIQLSLIHI